MGIQFITESTADLPAEYLKSHGVHLIPMIYQIDGREYQDSPFGGEHTLTRKEFYNMMREGRQPTTSQINEAVYTEAFEPILAAGDDVFYVAFSSGLTGSINNAMRAKEALLEKYPGRSITIFDTRSASIGEGMLVMEAVRGYEAGKSAEEIETALIAMRGRMQHWFTVEDLVYLKRGGRISAATAAVGTLMNIKPMLTVDNEGHLVPLEKVQGRKRAIKTLVTRTVEEVGADFAGDIYLVHADTNEADVNALRAAVVKQFDREPVMCVNLTPIIGAHTGPGLLALIYDSGRQ